MIEQDLISFFLSFFFLFFFLTFLLRPGPPLLLLPIAQSAPIPTTSTSPSHLDDLSLSSLSFTITRGRVKDSRLEQSAREAQQWIEILIGEPIGKGGSGSGVEELMEGLKSGVVLCKVANLVKPGVIASKKIKVPSPAAAASTMSSSSNAFGAMDNVAEFLNACRLIGDKEQVSSSSSLLSLCLLPQKLRCGVWVDLLFWCLLFSLCVYCRTSSR